MMTITTKIVLIIALVLSIIIPFGAFLIGERNRGRFKTSLGVNCFFFFGLMLVATIMMFSGDMTAVAATGEAASETAVSGAAASGAAASRVSGFGAGLGFLGAALSVGLSCIGGGIAVASAASAALGAISEDQSILGKSLIFVGLAEGIALYGLIIAFMILSKI